MIGVTNAQRKPTDLSGCIMKQGNQSLDGTLTIHSTGTLDAWKDNGSGVTVLSTTNTAGYTLRLVVKITSGNVGTLILQRLNPQGAWQTETEVARLV